MKSKSTSKQVAGRGQQERKLFESGKPVAHLEDRADILRSGSAFRTSDPSESKVMESNAGAVESSVFGKSSSRAEEEAREHLSLQDNNLREIVVSLSLQMQELRDQLLVSGDALREIEVRVMGDFKELRELVLEEVVTVKQCMCDLEGKVLGIRVGARDQIPSPEGCVGNLETSASGQRETSNMTSLSRDLQSHCEKNRKRFAEHKAEVVELRDQVRESEEVLRGTEARMKEELQRVREEGLAALAEVRGSLIQLEMDMRELKVEAQELRILPREDVISDVKEMLGDHGVRLETLTREQQELSKVVNQVREGVDKHCEKNKRRFTEDRADVVALCQRMEALEQRGVEHTEFVSSQDKKVAVLQQQLAEYLEQRAGMQADVLDRVAVVEESVAKFGSGLGVVEKWRGELDQRIAGIKQSLEEEVRSSKQIREVLNQEIADAKSQLKQAAESLPTKEEMALMADAIEQLRVDYVAAVRESKDEVTGRQVMLWELDQLKSEVHGHKGDVESVSVRVSNLEQGIGDLHQKTSDLRKDMTNVQGDVMILSCRLKPLNIPDLLGRVAVLEYFSKGIFHLERLQNELFDMIKEVDARVKVVESCDTVKQLFKDWEEFYSNNLEEHVDRVEEEILCLQDQIHFSIFHLASLSTIVSFRGFEGGQPGFNKTFSSDFKKVKSQLSDLQDGSVWDVGLRERLESLGIIRRSRSRSASGAQSRGRDESRRSPSRSKRSASKGRKQVKSKRQEEEEDEESEWCV